MSGKNACRGRCATQIVTVTTSWNLSQGKCKSEQKSCLFGGFPCAL
jgi:hypothetical protein